MLVLEITEENYVQQRINTETYISTKIDEFCKLEKYNIPIEEFKARCAMKFRDPSVWAYACLKDKQNKRLRVYGWQDIILTDPNRFVVVLASNQIGKTWTAAIKALHHALHTQNASVMVISKSEDQAIMILDEIKWMMDRSNIDFITFRDTVDNRMELHLKSPLGGISVIRTFPPTKRILGFPATLMICDEVAFWEMKDVGMTDIQYFDQCVEPRTNTTKNWKHHFLTMGQIFMISNPLDNEGLAYRCFEQDDRFTCYKLCWLAKPDNTIKEYLKAKERLPSREFNSVYAAEFSSITGTFISKEQFDRFANYNIPLEIPLNSTFFLGGDFAGEDTISKDTDKSVLYGVVQEENKEINTLPNIKLVYFKEFPPRTQKKEIYLEITELKNLCNLKNTMFAKFAYDRIGVGDSVKNDLIDRQILDELQIETLTYSLPNKSDVYHNLQHLFEQNRIYGSNIPELRKEMMALKVEKMPNSLHIKVHHKSSGIKDDHPDALANACYLARIAQIESKIEQIERGAGGDTSKEFTAVCPICEKEGLDPYHQSNLISKHFEKIPCLKHSQ